MTECSTIEAYEPVGTKVIVEVEAIKEKTSGGIVLPQEIARKEQDKITSGLYIKGGAVAFSDLINQSAPYYDQIPHSGDRVYFVKFAGKELNLDGKTYRVIHDEDIYTFERQTEEVAN